MPTGIYKHKKNYKRENRKGVYKICRLKKK